MANKSVCRPLVAHTLKLLLKGRLKYANIRMGVVVVVLTMVVRMLDLGIAQVMQWLLLATTKPVLPEQ